MPHQRCAPQAGDTFYSQLIKLDVQSGTTLLWREEGTFPGEPIFVPRPDGDREDDGILLSVVLAGMRVLCQAELTTSHR